MSSKSRFLVSYLIIVTVLALVRLLFPQIAGDVAAGEVVADSAEVVVEEPSPKPDAPQSSKYYKADGTPVKNRIYSVGSYKRAFPDSQTVQYEAASKYGVSPVKNREEAERRMDELVYIGANPYFHVDKLTTSIPYLVPRASILLQDIGAAFLDSLYIKGIPFHKFIVTSVMRTRDDVVRLRRSNHNATENSCHLYGTTFDICYNRYLTVEDPECPNGRKVRNDTLKWVLSEVLRDMRQKGRCNVKYEVKQGCFHITTN